MARLIAFVHPGVDHDDRLRERRRLFRDVEGALVEEGPVGMEVLEVSVDVSLQLRRLRA